MNDIESLLYQGESVLLDFKKKHYILSDNHSKAELIKDVLAFANAWRDSTAYILIGVDGSTTPATITGLKDDEKIDDAQLQQIINQKLQKPISFSHRVENIAGLTIAIIEIPVQDRVFYLKNDFQQLKKNTVYIRRGSSTAEATPEEIGKIYESAPKLRPSDLSVEFVDFDTRLQIGAEAKIECNVIKFNEEGRIPDYRAPSNKQSAVKESFPSYSPRFVEMEWTNTDYYREISAYLKRIGLMRKVSITLINSGKQTAHKCRADFIVEDKDRNFEFIAAKDWIDDVPKKITRRDEMLTSMLDLGEKDGTEIDYVNGSWHLTFKFEDTQPGRSVWPPRHFYIGSRINAKIRLNFKIFADEISSPQAFDLFVNAHAKMSECSLMEIISQINDK